MKRIFVATTVLLFHTGAAWAQQDAVYGPFPPGPGAPPPASPQPATPTPPPPPASGATLATPPPPPAPSTAVEPVPAPVDGYPPGYGPPPGYVPPPGYDQPRAYGQQPGPSGGYGGPGGYQGGYGPPPTYGQTYGQTYGHPYGETYGQPEGYYHYHHLLQPPPPRRVTDRPFTIGGGIGYGGLKLTDAGGGTWSHGGLSYTARLGIGLRPGLILLWDIEGSTVDRSIVDAGVSRAHSFSQTAQLAALQIFVGDRLFLKGGFGMAQFSRDDALYTDWGGAVMGGVGLELVQGWNWSLDVESSVTAAFYQDESMLNWSIANLAINLF